uniref:acyl-CoA-binding domain-containing protein 4 isoform X2 n=1 Tax=Agelaius phoeniceus TaxID=39638 RepID=UPI0023ED0F9B|nr:acyl-CoA-binding domain-containing protein 4 isoform X2 [Agelaius phoeniceus]
MEEPGCGAQFRAAVQVIQGLPRSGAYRPSYEEMLRFYSYYKQATAGRCQGPRPGFWDPIGRYKWDAWHSLGAMSKEEAMAAYVAEMKKVAQKVIDTVPMDESTQEMFRYFEPLYEVIHDLPRPPESFFRSTAGPGLAPAPEGTQVTSDSDGDTFSETLEQMEPEKARQVRGLTPKTPQAGPEPLSAGQGERGEGRRAEGSSSTDLPALGSDTGCLTLAVSLSPGQAGLSPGLAASPCLCPAPCLDYPGVCRPDLGPLLGPGMSCSGPGCPAQWWHLHQVSPGDPQHPPHWWAGHPLPPPGSVTVVHGPGDILWVGRCPVGVAAQRWVAARGGQCQPGLAAVCPWLCPQMCGCPWGAAPSRGCRRSWRRTWPARCGRCRRSCGGCGSGSAAWRRSGLPRGRQTPARHSLHRPCPGGACPCPHARCSSWPPGPSSPSGCCATGRAGRGDPRPPPPPALLAIPLRTEPRGNRLSSHRDTGTDTEGQHRPPRRHHAQPEPEQPRARPGLTRDITEPASIKVAFSVQPRCLCPPARGGECGQTLRPQPLSPAGHPLSLLGHPLSPCRVRLQAPACPPPAGCNAHPEGATGPRSGGGGGEAPGLPGTSVRGCPVRGWAGRVPPAGSSPREAAAAPGPSCAAPPQTWSPPRPGHGSPRRVSLSGALKPCQPPRTWGPRGTSPPWLGVAGPGTGSGPGPAQGPGPPHPPPSPCPSPRTPRASGARLRTAPAKRDAAPLREDFFPLRFVYISLRQLQHRRTPHGTGILPLAPFPPGPAHPRSPSRAPYSPVWLGSARPGPVQPPRSRGRSMVGGTSAAQGLFSDRATAPPRGERARCPRRGPEGRGARASPRTGTPPPRGTARSRLLPLAIGGAAQE